MNEEQFKEILEDSGYFIDIDSLFKLTKFTLNKIADYYSGSQQDYCYYSNMIGAIDTITLFQKEIKKSEKKKMRK